MLSRSSSSLLFFPLVEILVSSANVFAEHEDKQLGKSFMYNRNNIGPRAEPWEIPHLTIFLLEKVWSILHNCIQLVR